MVVISATEFQNNVGKYLQYVQSGKEVVILRNGKEVARLVSHDKSIAFLSDSLKGVLKEDYNESNIIEERLNKYNENNN